MANSARQSLKLSASRSGNVGVITLHNPPSLHALTLDMIHSFQDTLHEWKKADSNIQAIIAKSSSSSVPPEEEEDAHAIERKKPKRRPHSFCAGGDVKQIYYSGMKHREAQHVQHGCGHRGLLTADFFRDEYTLNHTIATMNNNTSSSSSNKEQQSRTATPQLPQLVSLWDGIVMGGGVGISIHGKYRVATENSLFAMPETMIGLFPDVGSMYWMPRMCQGGLAPFLALTGYRLRAADLLYAGIATHYIPSCQLSNFEQALIEACTNNNNDNDNNTTNNNSTTRTNNNNDTIIALVLDSFHRVPMIPPEQSFLAKKRALIDEVFGNSSDDEIIQETETETETRSINNRDNKRFKSTRLGNGSSNNIITLEEIIHNLETLANEDDNEDTKPLNNTHDSNDNKDRIEFGTTVLAMLDKMSPTSLKITLEGLRRGANHNNIGDDLRMEFRLTQNLVKSKDSDLYEGLRAALIDKDKKPRWKPRQAQQVLHSTVQAYFDTPIEHEWEIPKSVNEITTIEKPASSVSKL